MTEPDDITRNYGEPHDTYFVRSKRETRRRGLQAVDGFLAAAVSETREPYLLQAAEDLRDIIDDILEDGFV